MPVGVVLPSALRTTAASPHVGTIGTLTPEPADITLLIDVTAITSTPSMVVSLQQYDVASGKWFTIGSTAALTAAGQTRLTASGGLGGTLRTNSVVTGGTDITYSIGYITRNAR